MKIGTTALAKSIMNKLNLHPTVMAIVVSCMECIVVCMVLHLEGVPTSGPEDPVVGLSVPPVLVIVRVLNSSAILEDTRRPWSGVVGVAVLQRD